MSWLAQLSSGRPRTSNGGGPEAPLRASLLAALLSARESDCFGTHAVDRLSSSRMPSANASMRSRCPFQATSTHKSHKHVDAVLPQDGARSTWTQRGISPKGPGCSQATINPSTAHCRQVGARRVASGLLGPHSGPRPCDVGRLGLATPSPFCYDELAPLDCA